MKRIELETFLDSIIPEPINEKKILKELNPPIVVVNGVQVYKFNRTVDINGALFDKNITLSHLPYDHDIPLHMHDLSKLCLFIGENVPFQLGENKLIYIEEIFY